MAAIRLSTGSRMLPWPGRAWAANVDGSICIRPWGALARLPPAAVRLAAAGLNDDSWWAMVRRAGAHDPGTPVRVMASAIQASTLPGVRPAPGTGAVGPVPMARRRWAAKAPPPASVAGAGGGAKRAQISATRASMAAIPSIARPIGRRPAHLNETQVNSVKQYAQC